jgi:hypothetical protein
MEHSCAGNGARGKSDVKPKPVAWVIMSNARRIARQLGRDSPLPGIEIDWKKVVAAFHLPSTRRTST